MLAFERELFFITNRPPLVAGLCFVSAGCEKMAFADFHA
jgi:hypothetical protein